MADAGVNVTRGPFRVRRGKIFVKLDGNDFMARDINDEAGRASCHGSPRLPKNEAAPTHTKRICHQEQSSTVSVLSLVGTSHLTAHRSQTGH
ncbi:hypothetical protein [Mycobacteroides abscessus]|uniref:hypothetical protein n=1 Tax=Mycobacteroides abscessus TaxID=36809 RepID=UPI00092B158F|nr:hypothetical protein [Mycobacteroides abscessus]SHV67587.1 Uncharacterised protein [Mycobacteroides abscessus subsp. abscessus]SHV99240.1 Uncharacterised protein [Mycobacteroides abscessus subsp. abscessus]SIG61300.1 Uncharacterised protein [Mycobacteroides abscessus subsp. abscessus]SIJ28686.1 Uncharacterised protein [Mycobacteroides abscessus subsp. abscessus]SKQ16303.1 Uncharacterised protein [Mycobacteroides abscessus subsp. abscessus]